MKRLLICLIPVLFVAASCGEQERPVAVTRVAEVGDDVLSRTHFLELLDAVASNEAYIAAVTAQATQAGIDYTVHGEGGEGTYSASFTTEIISQWVYFTVLQQQAATQDIALTDDLRNRARVLISYVYANQEPPQRAQLAEAEPVAEGLEVLDAFDASYLDLFIDGVAAFLGLEEAMSEPVTDEAVRAFYDESIEQFEQACASHILVSPDETAEDQEAAMAEAEVEAQRLVAELQGGADFAELAVANSDDPGSGAQGGELGCGPRGQYVPEFEEVVWSIELDTISEPTQSDFGFHIILVTERGAQAFEEVEAQIRQHLEGTAGQEFELALQEWMIEADVTVNERYGTWNAEERKVDEPVDPNVTTTTVPPFVFPEGDLDFEFPEDPGVPATVGG